MLNKSSLQVIWALAELARLRSGKCEGAGSIAKKVGAPQNYLGKLLQDFCSNGIISSQKGVGGGFRLEKEPKNITLFEVVDFIEGVSRWSGCFMGREFCSDIDSCVAHGRWRVVRESYIQFLKQTTIADIMHN